MSGDSCHEIFLMTPLIKGAYSVLMMLLLTNVCKVFIMSVNWQIWTNENDLVTMTVRIYQMITLIMVHMTTESSSLFVVTLRMVPMTTNNKHHHEAVSDNEKRGSKTGYK